METSETVEDDVHNFTLTTMFYMISVAGVTETSLNSKRPVVKMDPTKELWLYSGPLILLIGVFGNISILLVMSKRCMRNTSTSVHLMVMALADLIAVVVGLVPEWFERVCDLHFKELHAFTCKFEKFVFFTFADTSVWVLVIFTLDRFVAVCFPLQKRHICTYSRAKLLALATFLASILKNIPFLWSRGPEYLTSLEPATNATVRALKSNCGNPTEWAKRYNFDVRPWIVLFTVNILPFVVIIMANVFIVRTLHKVHKKRMSTIRALLVVPQTMSNSEKNLLQMTAMCLAASFCFLVCVTPSIVINIGKPYWSKGAHKNAYNIAKGISNILYFGNHSINFFLYCFTGEKFRQIFLDRVLCRGRKTTGRKYSDWAETSSSGPQKSGSRKTPQSGGMSTKEKITRLNSELDSDVATNKL